MREKEMVKKMESLRSRLVVLVQQKKNFNDPKVILLSQEIDELIISIQRLKTKKHFY